MSVFGNLSIAPDPLESVDVAFGEWLPDLPEVDNPGAVEALNVIPSEGCYVPFKDIALVAGLVLPAECRGAANVFDRNSVFQIFAGTTGGVYTRQGAAFIQRYASAYTLYNDFTWQFVQFGNNVVALHPQVAPQAADAGGLSAFSPLGGNPPMARCGARVGDFLVLGNLDGEDDPDGGRQPQRIRWSGFNNIDADWITNPATQADFNDMPSEGGEVIGVTGREFGTVFQARSISRMSYVGLPTVFDIVTVEEDRGAIATGSIVDVGALVYFIANDGFHVWNGTNSQPIGDNKVNRWFFTNLNYAARQRIVGAFDSVNKCVMWAFPVGASKVLTDIIIYSIKENKFSHAVRTTEYIFSSSTLGVSIDDLVGNVDVDFPISFDDAIYQGGKPYLSGFTNAHAYGTFSGSALAATLDTAEFRAAEGKRVFVNSVRPLIDTTTASVTVQTAARDQLLGGALTFGGAVAQEITGECPVLMDARYMRFRAAVPAAASWDQARGVTIWRKAGGRV